MIDKLIFSSFLFFITVSASYSQETETRELSNFQGISVSTSIDAQIAKGNSNQIEIKVKGVELTDVKTDIEDGILKVGIKKKKGLGNWFGSSKVDVQITYTEDLDYLSVSSSADLMCNDVIRSDELKLQASSSGDMTVEVSVKELSATVSSSGDIDVSGSAGIASITASSSGDFNGKNLKAENVTATASSSGDIKIHAEDSITATCSSSGEIIYYGSPKSKSVSSSSGGKIKPN